jgi:hypothetical protein
MGDRGTQFDGQTAPLRFVGVVATGTAELVGRGRVISSGMMLTPNGLSGAALARRLCAPEEMADRRHFARMVLMLDDLVTFAMYEDEDRPHKRARAAARGQQRWVANPRIATALLRERAQGETLAAVAACEAVVVGHDTMEVDLHGRHEPSDAAPLRSNSARGYLVHSGTVVDATNGARGGFFYARAWTRPWPEGRRPADKRADVERAWANEDEKWFDGFERAEAALARGGFGGAVTHTADSEGSSYTTLARVRRTKRMRLVVRTKVDRACKEDPAGLRAYLMGRPACEAYTVHVREEGGKARGAKQAHRDARVELRFARVTLVPNHRYKGRSYRRGLRVDAVLVREVAAPAGKDPVEWMLLVVGPGRVADARGARAAAAAFALRWASEDMHKVAKSGCDLERTTVGDLASFERLLAVVLPAASHVARWTYAARVNPRAPARDHLDDATLERLKRACLYHGLTLPRRAWTVGDLVSRLARLGGYEPRRDRPPGWQVIFRGWGVFQNFRAIAEHLLTGDDAARSHERQPKARPHPPRVPIPPD